MSVPAKLAFQAQKGKIDSGTVNREAIRHFACKRKCRKQNRFVLFHDTPHFCRIFSTEIAGFHTSDETIKSASFFMNGIFGATESLLGLPNQFPPKETGPETVKAEVPRDIVSVKSFVIPYLLQKNAARTLDQIFIDEVKILSDEQIFAESGISDQVPSSHRRSCLGVFFPEKRLAQYPHGCKKRFHRGRNQNQSIG